MTESPEISVNGVTVGYGLEGMAAALTLMQKGDAMSETPTEPTEPKPEPTEPEPEEPKPDDEPAGERPGEVEADPDE